MFLFFLNPFVTEYRSGCCTFVTYPRLHLRFRGYFSYCHRFMWTILLWHTPNKSLSKYVWLAEPLMPILPNPLYSKHDCFQQFPWRTTLRIQYLTKTRKNSILSMLNCHEHWQNYITILQKIPALSVSYISYNSWSWML